MDLPRLEALSKHWKESPPIHISMAAYVGWGKSKESAKRAPSDDDGDFDAMMASIPQKVMNPNGG